MKKITASAIIALLAAGAGCDKQDGSLTEVYKGTPSGGNCRKTYKLPANITKCEQAASRH